MINEKRLKETFIELVQLPSPSGQEELVGSYVKETLNGLEIPWTEDDAKEKLGSTCGNIIGWLEGNLQSPPIMLNAHLDTVQRPDDTIKVIEEDGILKSDGTTILGADDKSGVAVILEVLKVIKENRLPHPPLQPVFTVCEEIGLLGSKNLDYKLLKAKQAIVLDAGNPQEIIYRAPTANRFIIEVIGKAAHAGVKPEEGINAIWLASKAIAKISWGRIDNETTCNIGMISGGTATNIVPERVILKGEVRSHQEEKLKQQTEHIIQAFKESIASIAPISGRPQLKIDIKDDYPLMRVPENHPLVQQLIKAGAKLGLDMKLKVSGGGSDANIFNHKGIASVIMGTGMHNVHSNEEYLSLQELQKSANILLEFLTMEV